jgi:membrane protein DedA with SNARE-associated domain/rhodanese-related sulfurtransferase
MQEVTELVVQHGLLLVFAATLAARIGLPVPAAPFLVVAGALAAAGQMSWVLALAAAIVGNILGDGAWFLAGRRYGYRVLRLLCRISISPDSCVQQSESFITRWGGSSLIAAKFVPGISVVAPPMAGALGMSTLSFLGFETLSAAIWAGIFLGIGAFFSNQIQQVFDILSAMGAAAVVVLLVVVAGYLVLRYWRRRAFLLDVEMPRIDVAELCALMDSGQAPVIVDVRSDAGRSIDARRIPGAIPIELKDIARRAGELPGDREIVLYCNCPNEASAARAARLLADVGLTRARPLAGGLEAWAAAGFRLEAHTLTAVSA